MELSLWNRTFWTVIVFTVEVASFNVDVTHPVIFQGPVTDPLGRGSRADTLFGYSVALTNASESGVSWMLVGAPRANSTLGVRPPGWIVEPGALFKCPLTHGQSCEEVLVDSTANDFGPDRSYRDLKDGGWLGGSVDVEEGGEGRLAVCAHRWKNRKYGGHYLGNGACYVSDRNVLDNQFEKLVPLTTKDKQYWRQGNTNVYFFSYGQAGTSVHFPGKGSDELVMGAPGIFDWSGSLVRYRSASPESDISPHFRSEEQVLVPNPVDSPGLIDRYDYFGYSLTSGSFLEEDQGTLYLVGAPRAAGGKGKAYLLDFPDAEDGAYRVQAERVGSTVGEYFGASVLAADLNGDGLCEMIVGAPLYSPREGLYEEGRVYVYMNQGRGLFREVARPMLGSSSPGARFGSSLASLQDLDLDGFQDFAVGAPYEDEGRGVIYIYRGGPGDLDTTPSQRIAARDIGDFLQGFGISISRGVDIDQNKYPDIAVGSYASGDAVLLRTKPVIQFESSLVSIPARLDMSVKSFSVQACLGFQGKVAPNRVSVNIALKIESFHTKSVFQVDGIDMKELSYTSEILKGTQTCSTFNVDIKSVELIDYTKPIQMSMKYEVLSESSQSAESNAVFIETTTEKRVAPYSFTRRNRRQTGDDQFEPIDDFCSNCPVANTNLPNQQATNLNVPFSVGCGADAICQTDLKLSYRFVGISNSAYIIGSSNSLDLELTLTNGAEPASLPKLTVEVPSPVSLIRVPPSCQERSTETARVILACNVLPHPFYNDSNFGLTLSFDMGRVTGDLKTLMFNVSTDSTGTEINPTDNVANITLALSSEADMEIRGRSNAEVVVYDTSDYESIEKQQRYEYIQHVYEVHKYLPTPVKAVNISFLIPVDLATVDGYVNIIQVYPPTAFINNHPLSCFLEEGSFLRSNEVGENSGSRQPDDLETDLGSSRKRRQVAEMTSNSTTHLINCTSTGGGARCVRMTCQTVSFLEVTDRATISIEMRVDTTTLEPLVLDRDRVSIITEGFVKIVDDSQMSSSSNQRPDHTSVTTDLLSSTLRSEPVPWWIIIVAVIGALLLLALITHTLHLIGFFDRKQRDEMENKQKEEEIKANFGSNLFILPRMSETATIVRE